MKHLLTLNAALTLIGCGTPSVTQSVQANNSKFVALGSLGSQLVQCTALQETVLPDGRLQVSANILNRANKRLDLQVNCIFKDEQGFGTGDETPFRTLVLDETAQETVLFTSLNPKAKNYTVRVRQVLGYAWARPQEPQEHAVRRSRIVHFFRMAHKKSKRG